MACNGQSSNPLWHKGLQGYCLGRWAAYRGAAKAYRSIPAITTVCSRNPLSHNGLQAWHPSPYVTTAETRCPTRDLRPRVYVTHGDHSTPSDRAGGRAGLAAGPGHRRVGRGRVAYGGLSYPSIPLEGARRPLWAPKCMGWGDWAGIQKRVSTALTGASRYVTWITPLFRVGGRRW